MLDSLPWPHLIFSLALAGATAAPANAQITFEPAFSFTFDEPFYPTSIARGDFNGDGLLDLVVSGRNVDGLMAFFPGQGNGVFSAPEFIEMGQQTNWVVARDFDGDGILDLAIAVRTFPGNIKVRRGIGDGTFERPGDFYATGRDPSQIEVVDHDRDGDMDLAVVSHRSDEVVLLDNLGDGHFEIIQRIRMSVGLRIPARPHSIESGNFAGGGQDLAITHLTSGHLSVCRNLPGGGYGPARRIHLGLPVTVATADLQPDGLADLLAIQFTQSGGILTTMFGDGTGGFARSDSDPFGGYAWFAATADFDGDGAPDVAVSDALDSLVYLLRNRADGTGEFESPTFIPTGGFTRVIVPHDYDFDCDWDFFTADIALHRIQLWRNVTEQAGRCTSRDTDGDGMIGFTDLIAVLGSWGTANPALDFNFNGTVDFLDLLLLLEVWG